MDNEIESLDEEPHTVDILGWTPKLAVTPMAWLALLIARKEV
jgi:hypothetical protein